MTIACFRSTSRWLLAFLAAAAAPAVLAATITVSAAASLTNAFREIGPLFERQHPPHRVQFNFAGSGQLLQQIAAGAPVDVFASADGETMDRAQQQRLVDPATRRDFAANTLVVVVPASASARPRALRDLTQPAYARIAIGHPDTVPAGRYARRALEAAQLWPALQSRLITAQNVRQALDYTARGEVDAGLVYATDAASAAGRVRVAFPVPLDEPIRYPVALVAHAPQREAALRFLAFLQTDTAREVLARHGFGRP